MIAGRRRATWPPSCGGSRKRARAEQRQRLASRAGRVAPRSGAASRALR